MREPPAPSDPTDDQALRDAVAAVLAPLARLAVDRGMTYAALDESLKRALVDAAQDAHQRGGGAASRLVSRISTSTGINRREVTRLTRGDVATVREGRSRASELFTHWRSDPAFRDARGEPMALPRQGPHPSFESLARLITQDVHPRSVLDELVRLRLAVHDEAADTVALAREAFVPVGDRGRMMNFLGANVGDHLAAAVDNVGSSAPSHLERAVFAERLSAESIATAERWLAGHWSELHSQLVPLLENLLAADRADASRVRDRRIRAGLYVYAAPIPVEVDPGSGGGMGSGGRRAPVAEAAALAAPAARTAAPSPAALAAASRTVTADAAGRTRMPESDGETVREAAPDLPVGVLRP